MKKSVIALLTGASILAISGCGEMEVSLDEKENIEYSIKKHYRLQDREIVVDLEDIEIREDTAVALVKLRWPKFSSMGKKQKVTLKKEGREWSVASAEDALKLR